MFRAIKLVIWTIGWILAGLLLVAMLTLIKMETMVNELPAGKPSDYEQPTKVKVIKYDY